MISNLTRHALTAILIAILLPSCHYKEQYESGNQLTAAAQAMEGNAKEAERLLQSVRTDVLTNADHAYYVLVQARVAELNGTNIAPLEQAVTEAKDYFVAKDDAPQAAFACFVLAKVYEAKGNPTKELHYYLLADDWASKANNQIPNFFYSSVLYNIALCHKVDGYYQESLQYLERALSYMLIENGSYQDKLYALELKALNFRELRVMDSSFFYFDKALEIARQHTDAFNANRILYNKYALLYITKEYDLVEKNCKHLLSQLAGNGDSIATGATHMMLAMIYANSNRADSAFVSIYKAKELLKGATNDIRLSLYETLAWVEKKKGNHANASSYRRQYYEYKSQLEAKRKAEEAELATLAQEKLRQGKQLGSFFATIVEVRASSGEARKQLALLYGMQLTLGVCFFGVYRLYKLHKYRPTADGVVAAFCRDELLRYADRQDALREVFRSTRNCRNNEEVGRLGYMVDELVPPEDWNWLRLSPSLHCSYAELLCKLRADLPLLSEQELRVCMLHYAHGLTNSELASVLTLEPEDVAPLKKAVRRQVRAAGYTSRKFRARVQRYVR